MAGYVLTVAGFRSAEQHAALLERIRTALPPAFEMTSPMPYAALQQMLDEGNAWGFHSYDKGLDVEDLTDEVVAVITEHLPQKASPLSVVIFYRLDGAYSEVDEDATATRSRSVPPDVLQRSAEAVPPLRRLHSRDLPRPEMLAPERECVRNFWDDPNPAQPQR